MLKVGLTGGIGAGKSAVASRLARLGAVLIDADVLAREVVAPGSDGLQEVVARFGRGVLGSDGALDRPALGARVFGDEPARRALEAIIHPRVRARTAELVGAAAPDAVVVNDVPLLVETGLEATYQLVVVVTAAEATRVGRLVGDRGMSPADAHARIHAQAGEARRRAAADVLLANDGTLAELESAVDALWHDRLVPFEGNLRTGRAVPGPPAPEVAAPDPTWPAQASRLIARVAAAVGDLPVRIDHVGSTAVPGLPARDRLDLQVVVPDGQAVDRVVAACRSAGFVPGRDGADAGGRDWSAGAGWALAADPGRPATIGLWPADDPAWRRVLLLRDWLRAHPDERDGYATVKRELAARADAEGYRRGTARWMEAALVRARSWADRAHRTS